MDFCKTYRRNICQCRILYSKGGIILTLVNAVHVSTGIVMSGDSRTSGNGFVVSDATNKVFLLFNRIGVVTAGQAYINSRPIEHYISTFEILYEDGYTASVYEITFRLWGYFREISSSASLYLMVSGYDGSEPYLYDFNTLDDNIRRMNVNTDAEVMYGLVWNGDTEVVNRLTSSPDYLPHFDTMNIQDAIDYSRHLIRVTIDQMRFEPRFPTVGGEIDTLLILHEGSGFVYKKTLTYKP